MIPKNYQLNKNEISEVFKQPLKINYSSFSLYYKKNTDIPKCAVIVSTKISKKAVVRNRIKRIFKNAFFSLAKNQKIPNISAVFVIHPQFDVKMKSNKLEAIISDKLKK